MRCEPATDVSQALFLPADHKYIENIIYANWCDNRNPGESSASPCAAKSVGFICLKIRSMKVACSFHHMEDSLALNKSDYCILVQSSLICCFGQSMNHKRTPLIRFYFHMLSDLYQDLYLHGCAHVCAYAQLSQSSFLYLGTVECCWAGAIIFFLIRIKTLSSLSPLSSSSPSPLTITKICFTLIYMEIKAGLLLAPFYR